MLWPIDTKLDVWVAYIKAQLGIATEVSVLKVNVTVTKNRKFRFRLITLLWLIDHKLAVWVAYIKSQLGIATQVSDFKVKVTVTKTRNSVFA